LTYIHNNGPGNIAEIIKKEFNEDPELMAMDFDSLTLDSRNLDHLKKDCRKKSFLN